MSTGKVKKVIDGDTIELMNGTLVRLANVNAPELNRPGGQKAKRQLAGMLKKGEHVGISEKARDEHGRIVAGVTQKGRNVNEAMKKKGY